MKIHHNIILASGLLAIFLIPPLVFLVAAFAAGLGMGESVEALVAQYGAARQNLLVCSALGLVPLAVLALALWLTRRLAPQIRQTMAVTGLLPILAVVAWVHWDFWPLFLPERTYPGFPHGLGFVIGPVFFAPVGLAIGLLIGWLATRSRA